MICGIVLRGLWSIFGVKIAEFRMQFLFKLIRGISDQIQKTCAVPNHFTVLAGVQTGKPTGNRAQQIFTLEVFFRQFVFGTVHIVRKFNARTMPFPPNDTVLAQKLTAEDGVIVFPFVKLIFR